jgi:DNA-binding GntR family transcriptional regulator
VELTLEIKSVTKSIVEDLRDKIITGVIKGGQRLNEMQVAAEMGISRPPLREAFRLLEQEHLLVSIPRKGTYVTEVSLKNLQDIYQVREMIECSAVDLLAIKNITDLPVLESTVAQSYHLLKPLQAGEQGQTLFQIRGVANFHVKLVEAADNPWLIRFYYAISPSLARYQFIYFSGFGKLVEFSAQHEMILECIRRGEHKEAKESLKSHLLCSYESLKKGFFKINNSS